MGLYGGLRRDLFEDAFAYRPLGRRRTDGPLSRRLPGRIREAVSWAPHAAVGFLAFIALMMELSRGSAGVGSSVGWLIGGLVIAAPMVMTLVRPIGAFWLSCAVSVVVGALAGRQGGMGPWTPGTYVMHLTVLAVVALRTRPRVAGWMWLLTLALGLTTGTFTGGYNDDTGPMAVLSALVLLVASLLNTRRDAQRQVSAEKSVTAVERDRRTVLEERTNIARELHDVVAHHMSVVAIQAEAAPYRVENPPPELAQAFATIRENAVAALTELRRVLGVVRAEDYEAPDAPQPTLADLDGLLANVREAGLPVEKIVTGAVRELPQGVELSAYRIIQEALSNTLRHAPGAAARVEIGYVLGGLGLRVVNGPATSEAGPSQGSGHGLTGMAERVAMLGGAMTAEATREGGYEVTVFIPVEAAEPVEPVAGTGTGVNLEKEDQS
ncbi:sensor histidine kinase [Streptomyces sp. NPDC001691]|uniref:sensor histidine kinase n=1 Tax=unclassified Streptomyces TaxID=2593676 RepID=UPI000DE8EE97|nr:histidine kinase [Streptomyces sp. SDr-06]RCH64448.1 two-component sensor histidine kinase [Streptomyces sp. SDr-06]